MLCVGGGGVAERSLRPSAETEVNYQGHLISRGQQESAGRIEQRLLSPLRSLALSPIPHVNGENHHQPNMDGYERCADLGNQRPPSHLDANPHRGGTLPRGYRRNHHNSNHSKMTRDEDVYDIHPRSSRSDNGAADFYGTIPRTLNRSPPRRTSSFQQLQPRASTTLARSQSLRPITESNQYKTAKKRSLYKENYVQEEFRKPQNPPPRKREHGETEHGGKRSAFSVKTAIKRKLASLTGHGKGEWIPRETFLNRNQLALEVKFMFK